VNGVDLRVVELRLHNDAIRLDFAAHVAVELRRHFITVNRECSALWTENYSFLTCRTFIQ
jgi:hypothetical protein